MPISQGEKIPSVTLFEIGENGPTAVSSDDVFGGRKVAIFGVPRARTRRPATTSTCRALPPTPTRCAPRAWTRSSACRSTTRS